MEMWTKNKVMLQILKHALDRQGAVDSDYNQDFRHWKRHLNIEQELFVNAVHALNILEPAVWKKRPQGTIYDITPYGRDYFTHGGDEGMKMLKHIEAMEDKEEKEILRALHLSTIQANQVNIDLAGQTQQMYLFQKRTTWLTLIVAAAALIVAVLGLFN